MTRNHRPDAILIVPPLSPSDTNPPLGPYLLRSALEARGLSLEVADLSAAYLRRFRSRRSMVHDLTLGDQGKCRATTHAARDHFLSNCGLTFEEATCAPLVGTAALGMHYSFAAIDRAVHRACRQGSFWWRFLNEHLRVGSPESPRVVGISLMGPPQVFVALIVARLCKEWWPDTPVVAGGSHVTLLIDQIAEDSRYAAGVIDRFIPGHCEESFAELVGATRASGSLPNSIGVVAGGGAPDCPEPIALTVAGTHLPSRLSFSYLPAIRLDDLKPYDLERVTLPMQLTRGCVYGRCTYCTYPAVEPQADRVPDWDRVIEAIVQLREETGVSRLSFKDSLFTSRNLKEFSRRLVHSSIEIEWSATTLLNGSLTPGLLRQLAEAGCRTLEFGLETIDPVGQEVFGKPLALDMIEEVLKDVTAAGILAVLNQILGWPGQSRDSAERQLEWYQEIRARHSPLVRTSVNFLEVNRRAPLAARPEQSGVDLQGVAPWAFSYRWNAPAWTLDMEREICDADL